MKPVNLAKRHFYLKGVNETSKCDKLDSDPLYFNNFFIIDHLRWDLLMFLNPREIGRMIINEINET
jgi:hypothetical protein